jgi:hypothetical protein
VRVASLLLSLALLMASCSEPSTDGAARAPESSTRSTGDAPAEQEDTVEKTPAEKKEGSGGSPDGNATGEGGSGDPSTTDGEGGLGSRKERVGSSEAETAGGGGGSNGGRSGIRPQGGRYDYAQSGWEEFCTATCERDDLPATQPISLRVDKRGNALELVSVSRSSEDRSVTTTSLLTEGALEITRLELRYRGFSDSYEPAPAVRSLQFPLQVGDGWSGSWKADTSGDYEVQVVARDGLQVDGREVQTFKLDTFTRFRGDFTGHMDAVVWIDPKTSLAIRSHGSIRLETSFGRFNSDFDTMLIEGPGY